MRTIKSFFLSDGDDIWGGWEDLVDYIVYGRKGNDKLYGYNGNDTLFGEEGNDEIYGSLGNDSLDGGAGDDTLNGGAGDDTVSGQGGNDLIFGDVSNDFLYGNDGNDILFGFEGTDFLDGGAGQDSLYGENDNDTLYGRGGADLLDGGAGDDVLYGNGGKDVLYGYTGQDSLEGGNGHDTLDGGTGNDQLWGGKGNDSLNGGAQDDVLDGVRASNNSHSGVNTIDTLLGGEGADAFILGDFISAYYDDGNAATQGDNDYTVIQDLNRLQDSIQLHGSASDYVVSDIPTSLQSQFSGENAGIYLDTNNNGTWDSTDELVAVVENLKADSVVLSANYFDYTDNHNATDWHPANDSNWELVFQDEFDGTSLDESFWNTRYTHHNHYNGRTNLWNNEAQYYVGDNEVIDGVTYDGMDIENGTLKLLGQKLDQGITADIIDPLAGYADTQTFDYTSGMISSHNKQAFTHGYMEIRAQVPSGEALWPAFWMLPTDGGWPPEIDVMEVLGDQTDRIFTSLHYTDGQSNIASESGEQVFSNIDFSADFHTFGAQWDADKITWFVDGQALYEITHDIPDVPMYLISNLAIGGDWPGQPTANTPDQSSLNIDYVRVYQDASGILHGGLADDVLSKDLGDLAGEAGNDTLTGGTGDNHLDGGAGDDVLWGSEGLDTMMGGLGLDQFILGDANGLFYDDGDVNTSGANDYANILDFTLSDDVIQLQGSAADYVLGLAQDGVSTEIWHEQATNELIGVVSQVTLNDFNQGFAFV